MGREMNHYQLIISEATKRTDINELELIEECMREDVFHSTLDWQTRDQLMDAANEAVALLLLTGELPPLLRETRET